MPEFHPCGMEDSFVYVGLNKNNDHRHGLITTSRGGNFKESCANNVKLGPRTIIENKTMAECADIASKYNSKYAGTSVGKYSNNESQSRYK